MTGIMDSKRKANGASSKEEDRLAKRRKTEVRYKGWLKLVKDIHCSASMLQNAGALSRPEQEVRYF